MVHEARSVPSEYEQAVLERIRRWQAEAPGPAARGFAVAAGPATRAMQSMVPVSAFRRALAAADDAGRRVADLRSVLKLAGVATLAELAAADLPHCDAVANRVRRRAMAAAGTGGIVFGVVGAPGMVADVSALLVLALRTIHRIAACYGRELADGADARLAIGVFALASANTLAEKQAALRALADPGPAVELADAAWRDGIERAAERELAKEAAVLSLQNLARQLSLNLGWRKAGGALPVIGAAVGGSVNAWYLHDLSRTAQFCFQAAWLQQRYPEAAGPDRLPTPD